jgi:predicted restriction endonuclease
VSQAKKAIRQQFRDTVLARDRHCCRACGSKSQTLDAHHITDRNEMPNGGYVVANGISLCESCHELAEQFHSTGVAAPGFAPDDLYSAINSDFERALIASKKLR